jgi:hypothetical protein
MALEPAPANDHLCVIIDRFRTRSLEKATKGSEHFSMAISG